MTRKHSSIEAVIVFGDKRGNEADVIDFETFCNRVKSTNNFECEPQDVMENVSLILCSSGTTGLPSKFDFNFKQFSFKNQFFVYRRRHADSAQRYGRNLSTLVSGSN